MPREKHSSRMNSKRKENLLFCGSLSVGVFLLETFDATRSVYELLLTGEERVAIGADFDAQHVPLNGGAGLERIAAGTVDRDGVIVGVNSRLHDSPF